MPHRQPVEPYNTSLATPALDPVANDGISPCTGFPPDTYDRYVLGLLDPSDRANVDRELEKQCPDCIASIQRSINLWLVFAGSLEQVEPSADFRVRLVRIAELSNRVLTVPKHYKHRPAILASTLVIISLVLALLLISTFVAGRQSAKLQVQSIQRQVENLQDEAVASQVKLQTATERVKFLEKQSHASTPSNTLLLQEELAKAQASNQQLQAQLQINNDSIERDKQRNSDDKKLVAALENPGAKFLTFKTPEGLPSTAYAFILEDSRVFFVASKLPVQHEYELWVVAKKDHKFTKMRTFTVAQDVPQVFTDDVEAATLADLAGFAVTIAPESGTDATTGVRVLETPGVAGIPNPPPQPAAPPTTN